MDELRGNFGEETRSELLRTGSDSFLSCSELYISNCDADRPGNQYPSTRGEPSEAEFREGGSVSSEDISDNPENASASLTNRWALTVTKN